MILTAASKGLAITNPLVQYRALLATNRITPDPAQYRLAIHLQKLYDRLKDYEPTIEYSKRLDQISRAVESRDQSLKDPETRRVGTRGIWQSLLEQKERKDSLALTRILTNHELARTIDSPKGLMLHGEVGTGKSMLIDLFADCLPNRKKRRWHFNTFILEVLATLEQLRRDRLSKTFAGNLNDSLVLVVARDLITKSPILFLDEFQLPDRAASKIMTNLMTSFFQLGGVLIATSNRMPEELHKASGVTYSAPPSRMDSMKWKFGLNTRPGKSASDRLFPGEAEFVEFLDVLKSRCEVWEMEGKKDYRRRESGTKAPASISGSDGDWVLDEHQDLQMLEEQVQAAAAELKALEEDADASDEQIQAPRHYLIAPNEQTLESALEELQRQEALPAQRDWQPTVMTVYGRTVFVPRASHGVTKWTFNELCVSMLGPADYLTLASTFHTLILTDVPVLPLVRKNEARRFITLLDALYEARCKLFITAAAGPDSTFFPDELSGTVDDNSASVDAVYAETLAEAYQDVTSPFRPNALSANPTYAEPEPVLPADALEDDPPNRILRAAGGRAPDRRPRGPDFAATGAFTGEDERFAFKRARSRLWEMCGSGWWSRQEPDWWRPLPASVRRWERPANEDGKLSVEVQENEALFRHGASPFRVASEPPPRFEWSHVWGTVKWGKRAGAWGQGVEGLKDRKKE